MSAVTAIRAAQDNIANHVSPQRDPALYNISVALLNLAKAIQELQADVDEVNRRVKSMQ